MEPVPGVPTEMMRSWVGQNVTVLAYSAGAPTLPAAGAPGGVPGTPETPTAGSTPMPPATATPGEAVAAGYSVVLSDFSGRLDDISGFGATITAETGQVAFFPWHAVLRIVLAP